MNSSDFSSDSPSRRMSKVLAVAALALGLAGCAGLGNVAPAPQVLDVGQSQEPKVRLPARAPIVIQAVETAPLLRGDGVIWREKGSQEPQAYASFQWASPPADLFAQRLRSRLAVEGPVVQNNVSGSLPELSVTLERFEQVFDPSARHTGSPASSGDIAVRAVLTRGGTVVDQLRLAYSIPAASADAAGGARALRAGVDAVAESIAQWLSQQPVLRAGSQPAGAR